MTPEERELAACRRARTDIFFSDIPTDQKNAKRLCFSCPVQVECLESSLLEPYGIFGGLLPVDRRRLAREVR